MRNIYKYIYREREIDREIIYLYGWCSFYHQNKPFESTAPSIIDLFVFSFEQNKNKIII